MTFHVAWYDDSTGEHDVVRDWDRNDGTAKSFETKQEAESFIKSQKDDCRYTVVEVGG